MRTQVGIIGSGPAGLLLSQLLHLSGISSIIVERRSRDYVLGRIRAGVLEQGTVDLLRTAQVAARMDREGQIHAGLHIAFGGNLHRIDLVKLTAGAGVMVYGQTEITRDLFAARDAMGGLVIDEAQDVMPHAIDSAAPFITCRKNGDALRIDCDFIAGCDGHHGVSRSVIPTDVLRTCERTWPTAWLGMLVDRPPVDDELIYINHERGFALCSMRSSTRSRYYLQVDPHESIDAWPDERFFDELRRRLPPESAARLQSGDSIEKSIAPLRNFVAEPMRHGRLFLAGDAAHIVPPTGAKGLNLAAADVRLLARAFVGFYRADSESALAGYSHQALRRVWKAQRFSMWLTALLHKLPEHGALEQRLQHAELEYLVSSQAAMTAFAENYVGLPFE